MKINIYQARNGGIYLAVNGAGVVLTFEQVEKLDLQLQDFEDFNLGDYIKYYGVTL